MKLNKLLSKCTRQHTDSSMPIVALLAGLAVGAVVGLLFAPEKGADVRGVISDKAGDLASSVKDKIQRVKEQFSAETEKVVEVKDQVVDDVRKKTKAAADQLTGETDPTAGSNNPTQNS
jgi:gas vesicle protein